MPKTRENRITPEIAGKYLGMSAQQVRALMESIWYRQGEQRLHNNA